MVYLNERVRFGKQLFKDLLFFFSLYWLSNKMYRLTLWTIVIRLCEKKRRRKNNFPFFPYIILFLYQPFKRKKIDNEIWHLFHFFLTIKKKKRNESWLLFSLQFFSSSSFSSFLNYIWFYSFSFQTLIKTLIKYFIKLYSYIKK